MTKDQETPVFPTFPLRTGVTSETSFRLGFQFFQISVDPLFRNSFAPVKLRNAPANFGIDRVLVFLKPAVLLFASNCF